MDALYMHGAWKCFDDDRLKNRWFRFYDGRYVYISGEAEEIHE